MDDIFSVLILVDGAENMLWDKFKFPTLALQTRSQKDTRYGSVLRKLEKEWVA